MARKHIQGQNTLKTLAEHRSIDDNQITLGRDNHGNLQRQQKRNVHKDWVSVENVNTFASLPDFPVPGGKTGGKRGL